MRTEEHPQRLGNRKGQHEMVAWQLPCDLFFKPLIGVAVLAPWTVPITAGAVNSVCLTTGIALINDRAIVFGTTVDHGVDHLAVFHGHRLGIPQEIVRAVGAEDVIDDAHLRVPPSPG